MALASVPGQSPPPGPEASAWQRAAWLLFGSPQAQASGMVNPMVGMTWLPQGVVEELIQAFPQGKKIGEGIEQVARLVEHPYAGKVVVKFLKQPIAYSGASWPRVVEVADRAPRLIPPTQYEVVGGKRWMFQPYVEPVKLRNVEQSLKKTGMLPAHRLSTLVERLLFEQGIEPVDVFHNVLLGRVGSRTRGWMPDVGAIRDMPETVRVLLKDPDVRQWANRMLNVLHPEDVVSALKQWGKGALKLSVQEILQEHVPTPSYLGRT